MQSHISICLTKPRLDSPAPTIRNPASPRVGRQSPGTDRRSPAETGVSALLMKALFSERRLVPQLENRRCRGLLRFAHPLAIDPKQLQGCTDKQPLCFFVATTAVFFWW